MHIKLLKNGAPFGLGSQEGSIVEVDSEKAAELIEVKAATEATEKEIKEYQSGVVEATAETETETKTETEATAETKKPETKKK